MAGIGGRRQVQAVVLADALQLVGIDCFTFDFGCAFAELACFPVFKCPAFAIDRNQEAFFRRIGFRFGVSQAQAVVKGGVVVVILSGLPQILAARFVRACHDLDDQHLFAWLDDAGDAHPVTSTDVNDYIRAATGEDFTAKHFRTWAASVVAFEALATADRDLSLRAMLEPVTQQLGNTPAIARKSYVHPALIELTRNGQAAFRKTVRMPRKTRWLSRVERGLIAFLERSASSMSCA